MLAHIIIKYFSEKFIKIISYTMNILNFKTIKKQEAHGPRFAHLSDSHCRHADVMQHFSNPIIATNENIIIWAVLSFEEEYMGLTVNGAWSFE